MGTNKAKIVFSIIDNYLHDNEGLAEDDGFPVFENDLFKITLTTDQNIHFWYKDTLMLSHHIRGYSFEWELLVLSEKISSIMETFDLMDNLKPTKTILKNGKEYGK